MITCPKCSKDNQDHYKFCLGCGAELPRDAAPKPFSPQTPPHGMRAVSQQASAGGNSGAGNAAASASAGGGGGAAAPSAIAGTVAMSNNNGGGFKGGLVAGATVATAAPAVAAPIAAPAPPPAPAAAPPVVAAAHAATALAPNLASQPPGPLAGGGTVLCPQCGHVNGPSNLFCGSCGFRLGGQAAQPRPAQPVSEAPPGGVLLTALRADGSEAGNYTLPTTSTVLIGRETGAIFAGDSYLSPRHATFRQSAGKLTIKDEASLNGVYKKLQRDAPVEIKPNDIFRIGQEIIRFEPLAIQPPSPDGVERLGAPSKGYVGRISLIIGRDATGNAFPLPEAGIHMGRERGDVLFPEDGYVSGLHCRLAWENGKLMLTDLGSSNGTFVRLKEETDVRSGDVLLMGQQLFRISM